MLLPVVELFERLFRDSGQEKNIAALHLTSLPEFASKVYALRTAGSKNDHL